MRDAAVGELDPVRRGEVVLVVVERGHRGRLGPGDLSHHLELQLLLALAGGEHPPAAPEERVRGDVELRPPGRRAQQLESAVAPVVPPGLHCLGLADADDLALVEHLQARRVSGGLVAEDVGAAGVDRDAAGGQPARERRSPDRPGSRRRA